MYVETSVCWHPKSRIKGWFQVQLVHKTSSGLATNSTLCYCWAAELTIAPPLHAIFVTLLFLLFLDPIRKKICTLHGSQILICYSSPCALSFLIYRISLQMFLPKGSERPNPIVGVMSPTCTDGKLNDPIKWLELLASSWTQTKQPKQKYKDWQA